MIDHQGVKRHRLNGKEMGWTTQSTKALIHPTTGCPSCIKKLDARQFEIIGLKVRDGFYFQGVEYR